MIPTLLCIVGGCSRTIPPGPELATAATIKDLRHLHYWYPNDKRAREAAKEDGVVD